MDIEKENAIDKEFCTRTRRRKYLKNKINLHTNFSKKKKMLSNQKVINITGQTLRSGQSASQLHVPSSFRWDCV